MANLFYSVCFLQEGVGFSPHTIMPICLPPDDKFHDNERQAAVVGLGQRVSTCINSEKREKRYCSMRIREY